MSDEKARWSPFGGERGQVGQPRASRPFTCPSCGVRVERGERIKQTLGGLQSKHPLSTGPKGDMWQHGECP